MTTQYHASESVSAGHPDKICDQVAAQILDNAIIASKKFKTTRPRVAIEVSVKGNKNGGTLMVFGEVTLPKGVQLNYRDIVRKTLKHIGYCEKSSGFYHGLQDIIIRVTRQSSDISSGVSNKRTGAGDQGFMFGGAVDETPELMPAPIAIAHALTNAYTEIAKTKLPYLRPDSKAQVVMKYEKGRPVAIHKLIIAASHDKKINTDELQADLRRYIIDPVLDRYKYSIDDESQIIINGAGPWTIYGPIADAGTTNRKIIVDSYGGYFPHGGGGFNGKDPTKVDLAGAVGTRFIAKTLVAEKFAKKVMVEVCYVIGRPDPLAINIETFGTEKKSLRSIYARAREILDLSVDGIIDGLQLFQPVYRDASVGGFFGRENFPWEKIIRH